MDRIFGKDLSNILQPSKASQPSSRSKRVNSSTNSLIKRDKDKSKSRLKKFQRMQKPENVLIYQLKPKIKQNEQIKKTQFNQQQLLKDPQTVPHYFRQCLQFILDQQFRYHKLTNYLNRERDINEAQSLRGQIVDWIVLVHLKIKMTASSLYTAVMIVDKYWNEKRIKKQEIQIVGAAAIFIAAKYQQTYQIPKLSELVYLCSKNISKQQILSMQANIIKTLNFELIMDSSYKFFIPLSFVINMKSKSRYLAEYIMQLSLHSSNFLQYNPSILAVSSIYLANKLTNKQIILPQIITKITSIQQKNILKCVKQLQVLMTTAEELPYTKTIRNKYNSYQFEGVSRIKPMSKIL